MAKSRMWVMPDRYDASEHAPLTRAQWLGTSCEACIMGHRKSAAAQHAHASDCMTEYAVSLPRARKFVRDDFLISGDDV